MDDLLRLVYWYSVPIAAAFYWGGFGVMSMTPPDFGTARWFVLVACLWSGIVGGIWIFRTDEGLSVRILAGLVVGAIVFVVLPETLRYISGREAISSSQRLANDEVFSSQFKELQRVTDLLGGKDENALRETFDFLRFTICNLKYANANVAPDTMTPAEWDEIKQFSDGANVQVYNKYAHIVRPNGGGFRVDPIPGVVGPRILSKKYLVAKQVLLPFETSPQMPTVVQDSIKAFDKTVDDDRDLLIEVIN